LTTFEVALIVAAVLVASYLVLVLALLGSGRRSQARALAGFVPDCAVLFTRLARDRELPRSQRVLIVLLAAYLASPIDLVPDFVPGLGYLDDALLVALSLRWILRTSGREPIERHWPGPQSSLQLVLRVAGSSVRKPRQG
jgi:uncharacterized membrane protein YkvA (DUF1232 family)